MPKTILYLSLCSLWAISPAGANAAGFECQQSSFSEKLNELSLGRISQSGKVFFLAGPSKQKASCPSSDKMCETKSYLVNNDEVLVAPAPGDYLCAAYKPAKGDETIGWLPRGAVTLITDPPRSPGEWVGAWRADAETRIKISSRGADKLEVSGDATYGASDPERVRRGAVNMGNLSGVYVPKNGMIGVGENYDGSQPPREGSDFGCEARLRLLGRYLVAEDNMQCGGMNVRFNGIYVRRNGGK